MLRGMFRLLLVLSLGATSGLRAIADQPRAGERHPEFTLPSISNGSAVSLSDFRGKKVLLVQFASW